MKKAKKDRFNSPELRVEHKKLGPLTTLRQLVERMAQLHKDSIIISEKKEGVIISYVAKKIKEDVDALGAALVDMGFSKTHMVIIGETSYLWIISYLAIVCSGNVAVPMDKELPDDDICMLIEKSDAEVAIYSDTFTGTVKKAIAEPSKVKYTFGMGEELLEGGNAFTIPELIKKGKSLLKEEGCKYKELTIDPDQIADIIFTSGTTGANKGVMLSHRNICTTVNGLTAVTPIRPSTFSVLPISHAYEKNCNVLGALYLGGQLQINDSLKYLISNMDLFRPHMSCMVPLILETLYKAIWAQVEKRGLKSYLQWGLTVSNMLLKVGIDRRAKFFYPVMSTFGGNFSYIICGGAPLRPEIAKGLGQLGFSIANGYGISECSPLVTFNPDAMKDPNTVGTPFPGVQVKIDDEDGDGQGEILVHGDNVMLGYYKDPEATKASFTEDGWFRTGDLGFIDKRNRLSITGRKKNLIILENGKNVHPEEIEAVLMDEVPYIKEVVVHASEKEFKDKMQQVIAAEIFIDETFREEHADTNLEELLDKDIQRVNRKLPVYKQVHCIGISEEEFEKTTSKKIRRHKVLKRS